MRLETREFPTGLPMAETNEPKKETVRIKLPPSQSAGAGNSNGSQRETVRINLPSRAPGDPSTSSQIAAPASGPVLPGLGQVPKPPSFPVPSIAEPDPSPLHSPSIVESTVDSPLIPPPAPTVGQKTLPAAITPTRAAPKKETARITMAAEPRPAKATVKMSKTQPLITAPDPNLEAAPISIEPSPGNAIESIPVLFGWALVAVSALVFIIQVWTYFS